MNMTSEDTQYQEQPTTEPTTTTEAGKEDAKKFTKSDMHKFMQRVKKMQESPEMMRRFANMQRRDQEYAALMEMDPEKRRNLLFHEQVMLMYQWREAQKKREKEERRKEMAA